MELEETIEQIAQRYFGHVVKVPIDELMLKNMLKSAALDGYQAGQKAAHELIDQALDNVAHVDKEISP